MDHSWMKTVATSNQKIKLEIQLKVKLDKILNIGTQPLVIGSSH